MAIFLALFAMLIGISPAIAAQPAPVTSNKKILAVALSSPNEEFKWSDATLDDANFSIKKAVNWWLEASSKRVNFAFIPTTASTTANDATNCTPGLDAKLALKTLGFSAIPKGSLLLILNASSTCKFDGSASVNGNQILITKFGIQGKIMDKYRDSDQSQFHSTLRSNLQTLIAHELGHSIGLLHSASLSCANLNFTNPKSCITNSYGDGEDVMGSGSIACDEKALKIASFSAANRYSSGWLKLGSANKTGTFTLSSPIANLGKSAVVLDTRLGKAVLEFRPISGCEKSRVQLQPGLEIRYLGRQISDGSSTSSNPGSDDSKIGLVKLNKSGVNSGLFIAENSHFFPGETIKLPGTSLKIRLLPSTNSTMKFRIEKLSDKEPKPLSKPEPTLTKTANLNGNSSTLVLSWNPVSDAAQYVLYGRSATGFESAISLISSDISQYSLSQNDWYSTIFLVAVGNSGAISLSDNVEIS